MNEIPIEELRRKVKRQDALLRRALGGDQPLSCEVEDMRTACAVDRIRLRKMEAADAAKNLRDAV